MAAYLPEPVAGVCLHAGLHADGARSRILVPHILASGVRAGDHFCRHLLFFQGTVRLGRAFIGHRQQFSRALQFVPDVVYRALSSLAGKKARLADIVQNGRDLCDQRVALPCMDVQCAI